MIHFENITLAYGQRTILREASLHLDAGRLYALVGRNGAGKSTLLRALTSRGDIRINGSLRGDMSAEEVARNVAIVTTEAVRVENLRVEELVAMGRAPYTDWTGRMQESDRRIVREAIEAVGMADFIGRDSSSLSDGERQRIMVARAIAQQTPIILLDEPTAFLDIPTRFSLCRLLQRLAHEQKKCILFSTHDIDAALPACDEVVVIENEQLNIVERCAATEYLSHLFGLGEASKEEW